MNAPGAVLERLPEDVVYRYTLSDMLLFLLIYYMLYEPFAIYARYPKDECNPLDIKVGAYIVELSKQLVSKAEFRESFRYVEEFIERSAETKRCKDILNVTKQILLTIQEAHSSVSL